VNRKKSLIDLLIHDLTGPISIISTTANNLLSKEDKYGRLTDRQKKNIDMILRNAIKAKTYLQDMIEVYRSEEGVISKEEFIIEDVIKEAVYDAVEMIEPNFFEEHVCNEEKNDLVEILKRKDIFITIQGKYKDIPFFHDKKKIVQILRNLVTNALKYRKKEIRIIVKGEDELIIIVEDDGSGIPSEKQANIFKRFLYKEKKDAHIDFGSGFGLSCVKSIVESMGGSITLISETDRGTRFIVRIPHLKG